MPLLLPEYVASPFFIFVQMSPFFIQGGNVLDLRSDWSSRMDIHLLRIAHCLSTPFSLQALPETKGKTMEEIRAYFVGKSAAQMPL